jgi:Zn-dependent membrane protease YugP
MIKHILTKITTFISQLSVGILLVGLMLLLFALLWTGLIYLTNELGNNTEPTTIEQVQDTP